jgi:hypothetical protein
MSILIQRPRPSKMKMFVTIERLREVLSYDPTTGQFTRLADSRKWKAGTVAGAKDPRGYVRVTVDGQRYWSHRLAFFYMTGRWPTADIDHINGIPGDDRFANLREATRTQNNANQRRRADNKSGFRGVSWSKRDRKWGAAINVAGKKVSLGYHNTAAEAQAAYAAASVEYFGEFGRVA